MNDSPASNFIEKLLGKNREILLGIIKKLFFEIHDLLLSKSDFFLKGKNEKLFEIKRNQQLSDFSGAADLFREPRYKNNSILKYSFSEKTEISHPISLAHLEKEIRFSINDEFVQEKIKAKIQNDYFTLDTIDQIAKIVIDINSLRNRKEHELLSNDFSEASLLFGYLNRLMALTPDHILESEESFTMYSDYLNNEFKALTKVYIPTEDEEVSSETGPKPNIDFEDLAKKISNQIKEDNDAKDKEIEILKKQLEQKYFYRIEKKKSCFDVELDDFYKIMPFHTSKDSNKYWAQDTNAQWGWSKRYSDFYIPQGAVMDDTGHIYIFHDKNDPYFKHMDKEDVNDYMFSVEEIEESWGPFEKPLELIRELSVVLSDESTISEEHESAHDALLNFELGEGPEPSEKQKDLARWFRHPPLKRILIEDWTYPEASFDKPAEEPLSRSLDEQAGDFKQEDLNRPTIETIIRKTRKETREQLLELRDKIYTVMTNHTAFDHWDSILNSKIIRNILNERIFTSEDFKKADIKPGYIWKTASKQQAAPYVKRDQASLELMDLQINQFWEEVQDITRNYFFDYDYIYNNKNRPWVKASLKYTEKDYSENTDLYQEVFNYLHKIEPSLKIDSSPFNEFSLSFIKAIKRNMKEFPNDDLTWEAKGNGFVIKKLRK